MHLANATKDDIPVMAIDEESRVKWQKLGYVVSPPANKFLNAIFVSWAILLFISSSYWLFLRSFRQLLYLRFKAY